MKVERRFQSRVHRADGGCLQWTGERNNQGYGVLCHNGKAVLAHRYALERKLGRKLEPGECALHTCDNPPCVDEGHLFAGTMRDNTRDCMSKGRFCPPPSRGGERNVKARLAASQVAEIRARYAAGGVLQRELAAEYGVGKNNISAIVRRETWPMVE